jgi:hypothetical protein
MDWNSLIGPAVVAAGISGLVAAIGILISARTARRIHAEKLTFDSKQAERKFDFDKELAEKKFSYDRELAKQKQSDELQLAERKFDYERDLHDHKRRVELAEEVLADFHRFADVIWAIRVPGGLESESADRGRAEDETPADASKLDAYYVPIARIAAQSDFFSSLKAKRYRSRALLGERIDRAFAALEDAISEVRFAAVSLSNMVKRGGAAFQLHPDVVEKYEATIFLIRPSDDPIEPIVKRAVEIAESVCRPILSREV